MARQRLRDSQRNPVTGRPEVLMYYYDGSAMAQVMDAVRERNAGPISYAVVGLGAGSLACRAHPLDTLRFYEIDPKIVRLATDPSIFTFISECRPEVQITLGDARLTLADAPDGQLRHHLCRCVHLGRDPDPPDDPRGDGDL